MALFESLIAANKAKSVLLVVLFILLYTVMIFAVLWGVMAVALGYAEAVDPWHVAAVAAGSHAAAVLLALLLILGGPGLILSVSRARPVKPEEDRELYDVVEEMAVASGQPAPDVYLIDEPAMNVLAVAGGRLAAVAFTTGLRERLDRNELQGVAAHALARIRSYDVQLMTLVSGLVGLSLLVLRAVKDLFALAEEQKETRPLVIVLLFFSPLLVPVVLVTPALVRVIQLAVSRERQFLADAEAARMTRYPEGLARALEKMAADTEEMMGVSGATAHLFIVDPLMEGGRRAGGPGVWSAHPDLQERIERLRSIGNSEG